MHVDGPTAPTLAAVAAGQHSSQRSFHCHALCHVTHESAELSRAPSTMRRGAKSAAPKAPAAPPPPPAAPPAPPPEQNHPSVVRERVWCVASRRAASPASRQLRRRRLSAWAVLLVALVAMAPLGAVWPRLGAALGRPRLISREELALHDGSRPGEAIWLAVCGQARAARRKRRWVQYLTRREAAFARRCST